MMQRVDGRKDLERVFAEILANDERMYSIKEFAWKFDEFLDELCGDYFFGTDGQCDPRGDHRE